MLTVRKIAEDAVAATQDDPEGSMLTVSEVLCLLDTGGKCNRHLENPLNHPRTGHIKPRAVRLAGDEPVYGDFLALTYCSHDPFVRLNDFETLDSLEQFLVSNSGTVNFYINYSIAIVHGVVKRYRIAYTAEDSSVGVFDKYLQNTQGRQPAERAKSRWIIWNANIQQAVPADRPKPGSG